MVLVDEKSTCCLTTIRVNPHTLQTAPVWVMGEVEGPHWESEAYRTSQRQATPAHLTSGAPMAANFQQGDLSQP